MEWQLCYFHKVIKVVICNLKYHLSDHKKHVNWPTSSDEVLQLHTYVCVAKSKNIISELKFYNPMKLYDVSDQRTSSQTWSFMFQHIVRGRSVTCFFWSDKWYFRSKLQLWLSCKNDRVVTQCNPPVFKLQSQTTQMPFVGPCHLPKFRGKSHH